MAILQRDEFFSRLDSRLGGDTSDEAISFLEDMTDTYNDLEKRSNGDGVDWEKRYYELDEKWKRRYRHRFFNGGDNEVPVFPSEERQDRYAAEEITVEDLFKIKEEK